MCKHRKNLAIIYQSEIVSFFFRPIGLSRHSRLLFFLNLQLNKKNESIHMFFVYKYVSTYENKMAMKLQIGSKK